MESATSVYAFLGLIGGMLGPVAGVMMADYFIIRKRELSVDDLYSETGRYVYWKGYNYRAFAATMLGALISLIGMYVPVLKSLYDISWFVGVLISFLFYIVLMRVHPPASLAIETVEHAQVRQAE